MITKFEHKIKITVKFCVKLPILKVKYFKKQELRNEKNAKGDFAK